MTLGTGNVSYAQARTRSLRRAATLGRHADAKGVTLTGGRAGPEPLRPCIVDDDLSKHALDDDG